MYSGFIFASWAVVWNDSLQTLGTFLASNRERVRWYWLTLYTGSILAAVFMFGWYINDGDLSWGRLAQIPSPEMFNVFHMAAPLVLLILTWRGIPVSTTFLVLSVFATKETIWEMSVKSFAGFGVSFALAAVIWLVITYFLDELHRPQEKKRHIFWVTAQWVSTAFLWSSWLMHDMANIAVYLPRRASFYELSLTVALTTTFLGIIFYINGGRIQKMIASKAGVRSIRSATLIDLSYALVLWFFKEIDDLPMSTTWVFVGLLLGREMTIRFRLGESQTEKTIIFPMFATDFLKVIFGFLASIALAFMVDSFN